MSRLPNDRLYFLCNDEINLKAYEDLLNELKINVDFYSESNKFIEDAQNKQPLGIIVDQKCLFGSSDKLKHFLSVADTVLPLLKVIRNKETKEISGFVGYQGFQGLKLFTEFSESYCRKFNVRTFRKELRIPKILKLFLSESSSGKSMFPGMSVNISKHGMFVLSFDDWNSSENLIVEILSPNLNIQRLEAKICWKKPFDNVEGSFPGIGLFFENDYKDYLEAFF